MIYFADILCYKKLQDLPKPSDLIEQLQTLLTRYDQEINPPPNSPNMNLPSKILTLLFHKVVNLNSTGLHSEKGRESYNRCREIVTQYGDNEGQETTSLQLIEKINAVYLQAKLNSSWFKEPLENLLVTALFRDQSRLIAYDPFNPNYTQQAIKEAISHYLSPNFNFTTPALSIQSPTLKQY